VDCAGRSEILLRLTIDHKRQHRLKSGIFVRPSFWHGGRILPAARAGNAERTEHARCAERLAELERRIYDLCTSAPRELLTATFVRDRMGIGGPAASAAGLATYLPAFLAERQLSDSRMRQYRTLGRMLERYETHTAGHALAPDDYDAARLADFMDFLRTEHVSGGSCRPRGHNTLCSVFGRLRALFRWLGRKGLCKARPFDCGVRWHGEVYGTPYYLDTRELEHVARADLSALPRLARQRDVFVFQCLTGCRVSDLLRLTHANIVDGALEYVAAKTRRDRPVLVRVPLHDTAAEIVRRYSGACPDGRLLPFVCAPRYNRAIRDVLAACGITRQVSVLDPLTQCERQRPIHEIAGSHLARRTFIGNLYRTAKDPCLVGALSGHKDGSIAFARYRSIDDGIKRELIEQTFCRHATRLNI